MSRGTKALEAPTTGGTATSPAAPRGALAPLRHPVFLALFLATAVSNLGAFMQEVGRAWLMTELTPDPLLVALVQSAAMAALVLFTLPAGVIADVADKRRVLIAAQVWMMAVSVALGLATIAGVIEPTALLLLTFAGAAGAAFVAPASQAVLPELVGDDDLVQAVALNGISFNVARAAGPALGGLAVAAFGAGAVFLFNALTFAAVIAVFAAWTPPLQPPASAPRERAMEALAAGLRYASAAPRLRAVLLRTLAFALPASALWALLPLVARTLPGAGPETYGILLGLVGVGSVVTGGMLPRLRARFAADRLLLLASGAVAAALLAVAVLPILVWPAMLVAGFGWMTTLAILMGGAQSAAPRWVKGRAAALFMLVFGLGMAAGGAGFGWLAGALGLDAAFGLAAALQIVTGLGTHRLRLPQADDPSGRIGDGAWPAPNIAGEPEAERGPVYITVEYRVEPAKAAAFRKAMAQLSATRKASGTLFWNLFEHAAEPHRYIETNIVGSWGEHLRQRARQTAETRALEAEVRASLVEGTAPLVTHWFGTRQTAASPEMLP